MKLPTRICTYAMFAAIFALSAAFGQSPAPSSAGSPNLQELQKQLQQLKQENQRLRGLLTQGNTTTATAPVKLATAHSAQTAAAAGSSDQQSLTHWVTTSSNKRHNSSCRYYRNSDGRPCREMRE